MKKRLTAKDLITVGIMVVLTMVAFMISGILGIIIKSGEYKSSNKLAIGYGVFTEWSVGSMLPMWIMKDVYFSKYEQIAPEYVKAVRPLTENYMLIVVVALGFVGALIGYFIGKKLLNKHFKRAGIV